MKDKTRLFCATTAFFLFGAAVLARPDATVQGIKQGLTICANVLVPSLFPFTVLSAFVVNSGACDVLQKLFLPLTRLFALPQQSAGVLLTAFTGGYPVGSLGTAELTQQGKLSKKEANRLMTFCVNSGPSFTVCAVGGAMLSSTKTGVFLFACVTVAALIMGFFSRFFISDVGKNEFTAATATSAPPLSQALVKSVASGGQSIYSVCAWTVLFSAVGAVITTLLKSEAICTALSLILEVTSAATTAVKLGSLPLTAAVIAFGGISVHCQVMSIGESFGAKYTHLLLTRLIHAALSFIICALAQKLLPVTLTTEVFAQNMTVQAFSVSAPAAGALMFLLAVLISDLDRKRKVW